ncbi:hypothetical protein BWR18_06480 [Tateyamaria omphalii]|uniref:Uncharacterized protein n=1 Tax=Tateyamaria omphalii TaxID=299262 RepID=A0A1P8MTK1_9RHOB|nr:hypothetical protein BWR18_06480 [Tateyamaria omphalii]
MSTRQTIGIDLTPSDPEDLSILEANDMPAFQFPQRIVPVALRVRSDANRAKAGGFVVVRLTDAGATIDAAFQNNAGSAQ